MSASQEKKRRQLTRDEDIERVAAEEKTAQKKKTLKRVRNIIIAVVVVLVIAAIFVVDSNLFYTRLTAVDVSGTKYSAAETNYLCRSALYNFVTQQQDYAQTLGIDPNEYLKMMGLDTKAPLDEQICYLDSSKTWQDYFQLEAIDSLREMTAMSKAAEAAGYVLPQEDKDTIEMNLSSLEYYASMTGYSGVKQYLAAQYGKGVTVDTVRKMMTMGTIAVNYGNEVLAGYTYTDDEIETYYDAHKDQYDSITYMQYYFSGVVGADVENPTDEEKEEAMASAKKQAEELAAKITDADSFTALTTELEEGTPAEVATAAGSNLSNAYSAWLLDAQRKDGDVGVIDAPSGCYVVMFLGREDNHYNMQQVRHLLVKAEADADGVFTDEAKAAAKEQAEAYLQEWKDGAATEESFADLANQHSEDTGSNTNGGLYDAVMKDAYVDEFEEFAFAPGRKPGDTGVVYGETTGSNAYAGYHVMYYVGEGQLYSSYIAENNKRSEDYNSWKDGIMSAYSYTTGNGYKYVD